MNRSIAPNFRQIDAISFPSVVCRKLSNGLPVYFMESDNADVVRFDIVFKAGNWYQQKPLIAAMTNGLMREGTVNLSSKDIAEKVDFFGSHLQMYCEKDNAGFVLYSLKKHLSSTIAVLADIVKNPLLLESELEILRNKSKQSFIVECEKVDVVGRKLFFESIYGGENPYGYNLKVEDYDTFSIDDVKRFYSQQYTYSNCYILCSGSDIESDIKIIESAFGDFLGKNTPYIPSYSFTEIESKNIYLEKQDAVQSAIRVGCASIDKYHPDYAKLKVVNTLLGGYFGSRLMKNIREDKGYTYGISSALYPLHKAGFFMISTEVGVDVTNDTVAEIFNEIEILQTVLVSDQELELVKSYMLGELVRNFDSVFNQFEMAKSVVDYNLDMDFYLHRINAIKTVTPDEIMNLACKYFNKEQLRTVIVGKK